MRAFLDENPADKHGVHRLAFSATGLDVQQVRERTRRYEEYFDVPQEHWAECPEVDIKTRGCLPEGAERSAAPG